MKVIISGNTHIIYLSRRNIENLQFMLDNKDRVFPNMSSRYDSKEILVIPEENDSHYGERIPGKMTWEL